MKTASRWTLCRDALSQIYRSYSVNVVRDVLCGLGEHIWRRLCRHRAVGGRVR